jgi:hypothetical protein
VLRWARLGFSELLVWVERVCCVREPGSFYGTREIVKNL